MSKLPLFDSHCDTISALTTLGGSLACNDLQIDLSRGLAYGAYAQYFALFTDMQEQLRASCASEADYRTAVQAMEQTGHASIAVHARFRAMYATFLREMSANAALVSPCRTAAEIDAAHAAGKAAAILMVEGAEQLEGVPLEEIVRMGIRAVTLTWNYKNWVGGSNLTGGGLTEAGRAFVRGLQSRGILVDLSHGSEQLFWDVLEMTQAPIVASHSNARALCYHPRNLTDEQFRAICRTGGLAGFNFCHSFVSKREIYTFDDAADHIEHFWALGGEKNVGLGGDLDGIEQMPQDMHGIQDVYRLADCLARRGHSVSRIEDLFFGNQYRLAKECWK